ncbi:hypothetical protein HYX07_02575 [Candidatus Woesearchaeota archaeon]|nr:hypothetical protein [Candidatus Woesearchaeota archaeon]
MIVIRYIDLKGFIDMGGKHLGKLQFLAKVPMNLGDVEFNIPFNHIGERYVSEILIRHYGSKEYQRLMDNNELLKGKKIFLVVED